MAFLPLINVDFTPLCGDGLTRAQRETRGKLARRARRAKPGTLKADVPPLANASGGGGCLNGVSITGGSRKGSKAILPIACNLAGTCSGKVTLKGKVGGGKASAAKKKTVGKKKFTIGSGQTAGVKLKLKGKARKKKKLKVTAKATVAGGQTETAKLKLKR